MLRLCVKHKVPIIITSLRPPAEVVAAVHGYGGIVFHDVINLRHAEKAAAQGVDGIIAVCAGAGGHAGLLSPFALVKQIREVYAGAIILSGAMSSGADVLATRALGADLAYLGTRFIATEEGNAPPEYKQMLIDSAAEDIVYTSLFSGVNGNYLRGSVARAGLDPDHLPEADKTKMNFGTGGNTAAKAWRDIWSAGQSVSGIHEVESVEALVARMERRICSSARQLQLLTGRRINCVYAPNNCRRHWREAWPGSIWFPAMSLCWSAKPRTPFAPPRARPDTRTAKCFSSIAVLIGMSCVSPANRCRCLRSGGCLNCACRAENRTRAPRC